jgi:hypothetical protein
VDDLLGREGDGEQDQHVAPGTLLHKSEMTMSNLTLVGATEGDPGGKRPLLSFGIGELSLFALMIVATLSVLGVIVAVARRAGGHGKRS